ncbi:MAG: zf-HC2 domain-containing protein [Phycisphaerae bacterium]|nr:zf-HC2 domain-containing protein [Phycisphaerae bacterium]
MRCKMNCAEFKELSVAYVEGLLDEQEKRSAEEHLKDCAVCRAELKSVTNFRSRLVENGKALGQSGLEEDVMNQIIREQNVRLKAAETAGTGFTLRRRIMKSSITRLAAAAAIVLVSLVGISQFFGGTVTFAEVIKPILNARTVVFDFITGEDENGPVIHDIAVGSRTRRTFSNMDTILIIDTDNAKMLTLDPKSKGAAYIDIKGPLQEGTKSFMEFVRNVVGNLKNNNMPVQELGEKEIDGQKARGFLVKNYPNIELTIWADSRTALPIRIEMEMGQSSYILKNIEFDVPVDESLVSMEPPSDYTLAGMEYNMTNFSEQDFVESLRIWAEVLRDGSFPEILSVEECLKATPQLGEKLKQSNIPQEEGTRLGMTFGRGLFMFFQQLTISGADWHYAGAGVKLGDAEKAIFWYQPKDSQTYRVIYGDLHIEDATAENLPK